MLPLTAFALEQLKPLRELNERAKEGKKAPPPFSSDGKRAMVVETLSKAVASVTAALVTGKKAQAFGQRDLRRTAETMLQKLGIDKELRAHLLSHGRNGGVQGRHYERYDFLEEKRRALRKWAVHLEGVIANNPDAKVRRLRSA
jgi:hypothetical protein